MGLAGIVMPLAKILGMIAILVPLQLGQRPSWMVPAFRWIERLQPWAMMEVYLLGVIVAYVKLQDLASIHLGVAIFAFVGTIVLVAAADARFDPHAIWRRLAPQAGAEVLTPRPDTVADRLRGLRSGGPARRRPYPRPGLPALRHRTPSAQAGQPQPHLGARADGSTSSTSRPTSCRC